MIQTNLPSVRRNLTMCLSPYIVCISMSLSYSSITPMTMESIWYYVYMAHETGKLNKE